MNGQTSLSRYEPCSCEEKALSLPDILSQCHQDQLDFGDLPVTRYQGELWTSRQRQGCSIHEVSYRGCFKPELPSFFIRTCTNPGDLVYDPFAGRGTTPVEAALLGRRVASNDINPLSAVMTRPRFSPPAPVELKKRLDSLRLDREVLPDLDLSMFYHPDTLKELTSLRDYLIRQSENGSSDRIDDWIRMIATTRLTGHSKGFFSVYTLPPNQAVSQKRQIIINERLGQEPEYRDIKKIILKKSRSLIRTLSEEGRHNLESAGRSGIFLACDARATPSIGDESVSLTVTSPPFLDVVQYPQDNWLRCWFNGLDASEIACKMTLSRSVAEWSGIMKAVFEELYRITRPGGYVAFEVGEVRNAQVRLDEAVVPVAVASGFSCTGILVNEQKFTKTSHIWGVSNNQTGTNTNRIVLLEKRTGTRGS